jgi:hypothetical protein
MPGGHPQTGSTLASGHNNADPAGALHPAG